MTEIANPKQMTDRTTKYSIAVRSCMESEGHATNTELISALRSEFPDVSATTIHRVTARMLDRGELSLGPVGHGNVMRYDVNTDPHDHFMCNSCGMIRDTHISDTLRPLVEKAVGDGCSISGSLTVSGICKNCNRRKIQ